MFQGEIEFIGRAMVRPLVKKAEQKYEGPLFPPKLEWFQIYRGDNTAGELLAAFELFQVHRNIIKGKKFCGVFQSLKILIGREIFRNRESEKINFPEILKIILFFRKS